MKKISITIAGGTGYTAGELLRILINHPRVEKINLLSTSSVGERADEHHRDLFGETDLVFTDDLGNPDLIFLCLGHGLSKSFMDSHDIPKDCKIIDLGNDFRLDPNYQDRHFVYGLVDTFKSKIKGANNIANPGCFATAIQSAIAPLACAHLLKDEVHVTALTGSTGAGKKPAETTHFSYRSDNISIYKNFSHQHLGEIKRTLAELLGQNEINEQVGASEGLREETGTAKETKVPQINFVPMRGDFARGIFASIYTRWDGSLEEAEKLFENHYKDAPFTFISKSPISLKEVVNTNKILLHLEIHNGYLHISSIIDNLVKGASGQAVENMNLIFGFEQTEGLKLKANLF